MDYNNELLLQKFKWDFIIFFQTIVDQSCIYQAGIGPRKKHRKEMKAAHQAKQATVIGGQEMGSQKYITIKKRFVAKKQIFFGQKVDFET